MVCVCGWRPPRSIVRPGKVTSMRSASNWAARAADSSPDFLSSSRVCTRALAALINCPAAGRSSAGRRPSVFSSAVSSPFFPRNRTRSASRVSVVSAASTAASASATSVSSASIALLLVSRLRALKTKKPGCATGAAWLPWGRSLARAGRSARAVGQAARACFAVSTSLPKAAFSLTARSASILRSTSTSALFKPSIRRL